MKASFCVHSYNEADALRRLVLSSLPMAGLFDEWVILDHRSDDDTQGVMAELRPLLAARGVILTALQEPRDFSAAHTFADVRNRTVQACRNPVAALLDADFILGPAFASFVQQALEHLLYPGSQYHGATYAVPCIWDTLETDASCRIVKHGRVWVHNRRPRILCRDAVHYAQTGDGGRWERLVLDDARRPALLHLTPLGGRQQKVARNTVVSCNVKSAERIALRDTMTMFLQDAISGGQQGEWLQNYAAGTVRNQPPYPYHPVQLAGWRLHAPNLRLSSASVVSA